MELIATKKFRSPISLEYSMLSQLQKLGEFESEMQLYYDNNGSGFIEWIVDELDMVEQIGLAFENKVLVDYDGVFSFPEQGIILLEENGFNADYVKEI